MGNKKSKVAQIRKSVSIDMRFSRFALPPVRDAMVIGKKARIGPHAIEKAFEDLTPGMFRLFRVDHPVIEAVLIRKSILRKMNEEALLKYISEHAEKLMDETDSLRIEINLEIDIKETIEIQA